MPRIAWVGQSATPKSSNVSNLRLVNGYAEIEDSKQGKTAVALYGTPGLTLFAGLAGAGPVRGAFTASNGRCFAVSAQVLSEIMADGSTVSRGNLNSYSGPVDFDDNGSVLFLVDGPSGYMMPFSTNVLAQISDPNFFGANRVGFIDQYMVFNRPGTQQFYWTNVSSTVFDALNFASVEGSPDNLVSLLVVRREIWLFGTLSTEVWFDSGNLNNPFQRIEGAFVQQGCAAPQSPARVGDAIVWLSANDQGERMVVMAQGYQALPISTYSVASALQTYATVSDAIGWGQQQDGHLFYWLTFPTAGHTWVYDLAMGLWHERAYLQPASGTFTRHRANAYTYAFGRHLVGDYINNRLYQLDSQAYTDASDPLVFEATLPPFFDTQTLDRVLQSYLQIDAETGVGLDASPTVGTNPQLVLQLSNDSGHTWGVERPRSIGKIGQTSTRVQWARLGSAYDRRCRIRISDPVKRVILGAVTEVEVLGV